MDPQWRSVFRDGLFEGKAALVTGGGTGIGKAIALELLQLGCNVVIASRKEDALKEAADLLRSDPKVKAAGGKLEYTTCDIRKQEDVEAMVQFVLENFKRLDFLVNNAGGQYPSPASIISPNGWRSVIDLNLNGTFMVCREAFERWFEDHGGSIVNVTAAFQNGFPMMSHTSAARAGVANLSETLAVEWAPFGVRINCVSPGPVFSDSAVKHYANLGQDDLLTRQGPNIPAGRIASTEEVSSGVLFLLSPGASYITGCTIKIDGGSKLFRQLDYELSEGNGTYPRYGTLPPPTPESKL